MEHSRFSRITLDVVGAKRFSKLKAIRQLFPLVRPSYSQFGEDLGLANFFHGRRGNYLDIGAGNPLNLSNSYLAYRRGWSGVAVEPCVSNVSLGRVIRRRDLWLQGLVSSSSEPMPFFELDPSFYSTTDPAVRDLRLSQGAKEVESLELTPFAVADLPFEADPQSAAFVTIDVEGHELSVLQSFDWSRQTPPVIVVELWAESSGLGSLEVCSDLLNDMGYQLAARLGPDNHIFLHRGSANVST